MLRRVLNAVYGVIRWISKHVRDVHAAIGLFLTLGLAVSVMALGAFLWIARAITVESTPGLDTRVLMWLHGRQTPAGDVLALAGAALGSAPALWVVLGLGSLYFLRTRHLYSLAILWLSLLGAHVLNGVLKAMYQRPRPQLSGGELEILGRRFDYPTSYSFPSGHAITAVVVFGTLAYLVVRLEPTVRTRRLTLVAAALVIVVIGASRVYLGVHYPSDVLAGYLAGFIWSTSAVFTIEVVRYFARGRPELHRGEADLGEGLRPLGESVHGETKP